MEWSGAWSTSTPKKQPGQSTYMFCPETFWAGETGKIVDELFQLAWAFVSKYNVIEAWVVWRVGETHLKYEDYLKICNHFPVVLTHSPVAYRKLS